MAERKSSGNEEDHSADSPIVHNSEGLDAEVVYDEFAQTSQNPAEVLHRSFISSHQDFQRQRDTIITWQDKHKHDYALSFQDHRGA